MGAVAILPSDHSVSDDAAFMDHVEAAFDALAERRDLVVLLGIAPESPETEYGWIEAGAAISCGELRRVRRFWEKPSPTTARALLERGCLWNSFVVVARIPAFLRLIRAAVPELDEAFAAVRTTLGTPEESRAVAELYAGLASIDFSHRVLATHPANLAVLLVTGVVWSDWGQPRRVLATLARLGLEPEWARRAAPMVASG
jgi:mannose-1-phosphate guanylyltransferase